MAGKGSRFAKDGFGMPKPLLEIHGKPFFYWAAQSIKKFVDVQDVTFVVLKEHVDMFCIDRRICEYYPSAVIHVIPQVLNGAAMTCLKGVEDVPDCDPIVFNDCDHLFRSRAFEKFAGSGFDLSVTGALLTFESTSPKYSFLDMDDMGNVVRTIEKIPVSSHAICGCYYFRSKRDFERAVTKYMKQCEYNELYMSGVYNVMAAEGEIVKSFPTDYHVSFGVPEEYAEAKVSKHFDEME